LDQRAVCRNQWARSRFAAANPFACSRHSRTFRTLSSGLARGSQQPREARAANRLCEATGGRQTETAETAVDGRRRPFRSNVQTTNCDYNYPALKRKPAFLCVVRSVMTRCSKKESATTRPASNNSNYSNNYSRYMVRGRLVRWAAPSLSPRWQDRYSEHVFVALIVPARSGTLLSRLSSFILKSWPAKQCPPPAFFVKWRVHSHISRAKRARPRAKRPARRRKRRAAVSPTVSSVRRTARELSGHTRP
jgi:hypothetical protein